MSHVLGVWTTCHTPEPRSDNGPLIFARELVAFNNHF